MNVWMDPNELWHWAEYCAWPSAQKEDLRAVVLESNGPDEEDPMYLVRISFKETRWRTEIAEKMFWAFSVGLVLAKQES